MIRGQEFHSILKNIFEDVKGYMQYEQIQINCPYCQERDGLSHPDGKYNLEINTYKRRFRCWKCDDPKFSGSLGRLIRIFGTNADYEIYKSYAGTFQDYDFEEDEKEFVPVKLPAEMIPFSQMDNTNLDHLEAYTYIVADRKISKEKLLKYRIGFCTTGKYFKRIIIPSYDNNGELNYFVSRTYDEKIVRSKYDNPKSNKDIIIFNECFINWDSTIYLVEGAFEMLSIPNAIPMLGKNISTMLFKKLKLLKPNVVVLLDPDAYKNSVELFFILHDIYVDCEERVKIVKLPTNDDLDELRRFHGDDEVIKALYTARGLTSEDYFIKRVGNTYDSRRRFNNNTKRIDWKSGSTKNFI